MVKNPLANAGHTRYVGLVPGLGRSPGVGNGNPVQYSCLENSKHRRVWQATAHGVPKSHTQLSGHTHTHTHTEPLWPLLNSAVVALKQPLAPHGQMSTKTSFLKIKWQVGFGPGDTVC